LKLKSLCVTLFATAGLSLSACQTLVPNPEICTNVAIGGHCKTIATEEKRDIPEPYWSTCEPVDPEEEDKPCVPKLLLISPEGVGEFIKFVETICDRYQNCVAEDKKKIDQAWEFLYYMEGRML